MFKVGDKVKRIGGDFQGVEKGNIYTVKNIGHIRSFITLEEVGGAYIMTLFELVKEKKYTNKKVKEILSEELKAKGLSCKQDYGMIRFTYKNIVVDLKTECVCIGEGHKRRYYKIIDYSEHKSINKTLKLVDKLIGKKKENYLSVLNSLIVCQNEHASLYWHYDNKDTKKSICLRLPKFNARYDSILVYDINDLEGIKKGVEFLRNKK